MLQITKFTRIIRFNLSSELPLRTWSQLFKSISWQEAWSIELRNKMCLWSTNAPDNCQFQRWSKSQGQISWYQWEDHVTRNAHVNYENSNIYHLEFMTNVNEKKVKCQGQKVKYHQKGLTTRNTHVKYQSSSTQKLLASLKFLKNGSNSKVKVSKIMERTELSNHKEYSCDI